MQKFYDVRYAKKEDAESLKRLWARVFNDPYEYIDHFFSAAFVPENVLCVSAGGDIVSALYLLECNFIKGGKTYSAMYIYAVATLPEYRGNGFMRKLLFKAEEISVERKVSYLFLVPSDNSLYHMYEKQGYKKGFFRKERSVDRFLGDNASKILTYDDYINYRNKFSVDETVFFGSEGFFAFYGDSSDVRSISLEGEGYCSYSRLNESVIVFEIFGNEKKLLSEVFRLTEAEKLVVFEKSDRGGKPCGMYKIIGDAPEIENAFIGVCGE